MREADAAMRQETPRLNLVDGTVYQQPKLLSLFLRNCGPEVLDFYQSLANEYDLGHVFDAGNPGIAD